MKTIKILVLLIAILVTSCETTGELTKNSNQNADDVLTSNAVLKYSGTFQPTSGISGTGETRIYLDQNKFKLILYNYSIETGPDLKVYLSKTNAPNEFINLGSVNENSVYIIPSSANIAEYPFVLIHCQQYDHLFAIAPLASN